MPKGTPFVSTLFKNTTAACGTGFQPVKKLMDRIAADPLAAHKLVFVGLEYRARIVLKRWQQRDRN